MCMCAAMAAAGAARYMDCIGAHYNEGIVSPNQTSGDPRSEYFTRYFWGMVNTYYGAFGGARPVCFTELGYLSPEGLGPLPGSFAWGSDTTVAEQAQWLRDAVQSVAQQRQGPARDHLERGLHVLRRRSDGGLRDHPSRRRLPIV